MPRVVVRFFSLLREAIGRTALTVDVPEDCSVRCLLEKLSKEYPKLAKVLEALEWDVVVLINGRPASLDDRATGEVTVFPPAAGGGCKCKGEILSHDIDLDDIVEWLASSSPEIGAVAVFVGIVRGINDGEKVVSLEYEYHPELAGRTLDDIAREIARKHGVHGVYIGHYVGVRRPGERTIIVAVAASHRAEAFRALTEAVDKVKHQAPIWKTEHRTTGRVFIVGDKVIREKDLKD